MDSAKRARAGLLFVGFLLGVGTPFLIMGLTMHATGTKMKIEIVKGR